MNFESQRINVEVTAWYWHFLGVLWFGIFALLHFAKG
jgi:heme/copper-type cytochrome/quinol oxidase subunit 3